MPLKVVFRNRIEDINVKSGSVYDEQYTPIRSDFRFSCKTEIPFLDFKALDLKNYYLKRVTERFTFSFDWLTIDFTIAEHFDQ